MEWKSIKESVPEIDKDVLVCTEDGSILIGKLCYASNTSSYYWVNSFVTLQVLKDACYWMPLPEVPEEVMQKVEGDDSVKLRRRPPFKFSMVGLKPGDKLVFISTNQEVEVNDEKTIKHKGIIYSLTSFTRTFLPGHLKYSSDSYDGPAYFSYNGENLVDMRKRFEKERGLLL